MASASKSLVAKKTFKSSMIEEGSWGARTLNGGKKLKSTMALHFNRDNTGYIEWDIPALDRTEEIGLTFEFELDGKRKLVDYDGLFSIPDEAVALLKESGVDVSEYED